MHSWAAAGSFVSRRGVGFIPGTWRFEAYHYGVSKGSAACGRQSMTDHLTNVEPLIQGGVPWSQHPKVVVPMRSRLSGTSAPFDNVSVATHQTIDLSFLGLLEGDGINP